jgi:hypothetical protein
MNFLYIGPYRQKDYVGQLSLLHINSIKKSISSSDTLITRPLYLDTAFATDFALPNEMGCLDSFDFIIQYMPIEFIAIKNNTKIIAIPILDPKLYSISHDYQYSILNLCYKILVDEEKNKYLLKASNINKPIELYEETLEEQHTQKFNLDTLQNSYKFGFIGKYQPNKQILNKIIYSFLVNYRLNNNIKLYLFLIGSDQDKAELENQINKIKKELGLPEYISPIICIFGSWEQKNATIALDSLDCFLSLNEDCKYLLYDKFFMSNIIDGKKFLITCQNINTIETPITKITNYSEYKNTFSSIHTQDLINKMKMASQSQQKYKQTNYRSLGEILCK